VRLAVYHNNHDIRIEERPVPAIGPGEVLLRVRASGICGSDVMEWYRAPKAPIVLGHEIAAEIAAIGDGVTGWKAGDRVFASHHVPCLHCRYCLAGHATVCDTLRKTNFDPGGFAEYVRLPAINVAHGLFRLPPSASFEEGSFVEPLGCTVRGQRAAGVQEGDTVLVIGSGLTGLLHVLLAKAQGASAVFVTDPIESRRSAAMRFGSTEAFDAATFTPEQLRGANGGRLADRVIVCTGASAAFPSAFRCVDRGGSVLFFAPTDPGKEIPMPLNDLWHDEVTLTSSYGASPRDIEESLFLLGTGRVAVKEMISHRLPLEQAAEGFRLTAEACDSLKVLLLP